MNTKQQNKDANVGVSKPLPKFVSLKTISKTLDVHRTTVRRWLADAGIRPVAFGDGVNGAIRYEWTEVTQWIASREKVS